MHRALLASTCLTGSGAAAFGGIITEGIAPAPTDFGNTSGTAYLLPVGTTPVFGALTPPTDSTDWFQFQGLAIGTPFTLSFSGPVESGVATVLNSSFTQIYSSCIDGEANCRVPFDSVWAGNIYVGMSTVRIVTGTQPYNVTLTTPVGTPEPGTAATAGLALAGAIAWRKRRAKG